GPEWKRHAEATRSVEREQVLLSAVDGTSDAETMLGVFMQPPVYQTAYGCGYGTLYTAIYRPADDASAELIWPRRAGRNPARHSRRARGL
ncbi:hypothetical protein MJ877_36330, partial [Mesorhizobium jarvisii]|nr:hypothetical protein [Mesorhizobium jarvisii]